MQTIFKVFKEFALWQTYDERIWEADMQEVTV
jgi:hypothetical protein